ncbi:Protein of unknown function [Devosia lucknowensis]|uniref:DUF1176 domain-containing protein n=1 Tax=Devosia lucknowensis TaxID=1096929 RepID=A0A1Y6EGA8_9HYPH|nr:hypothetical protein [Devosia lucknowensis]SMQ61644.1 Protein of unknown function [Devosia lucknowensis]
MRIHFVLAASLVLVSLPSTAQEGEWKTSAIEKAISHHQANRPEVCVPAEASQLEPASFELQIGEDTAARQALIVEFPCQIGAYNQTSVYLLSDQHGTVSEILFPSPQVDISYQGEGEGAPVDDITIIDTPDLREVVNPQYDPSSRTMTERNKMRGLDDAYAETRWGFKNGKFEITYFAVDATFDREDNPVVLIEREIW